MAGRIQNEDIRSQSEMTGAGGAASQLINDTKIWITALGLNERLDTAITNGDLSGGGGSSVTTQGNMSIQIRPTTASLFVLQSPDTTKWDITVSNIGGLIATSGSSGTVTNIKVTKPDTSEASFAITNGGVLQVISPPSGGETLNNDYFIEAADGGRWNLTVTNANAIQMVTNINYFRVLNDLSNVLFQIQEVDTDKAIQYMSLLSASTLPSSPTAITGTLPWAFYDTGSVKRPIFHDGISWKFFSDNSNV